MMQPLEPGDPRSAGEFRLRARLGAGGMGRVYLGYSPAGRAVAVKICHPEFAADPAFVRRFALEVAAARAVNGLYTAQVIDAGPDDIPPWLATSYVPGPSLYEAVGADGPLPEAAVWRLAAGLAEALQAVHASGLVHRDLKPTNVLLAADGPRVIDFGVARALDGTSLTTTGIAFGTPSYMSPEQGSGDPIGPASDVFALGCVLCFAASGGTPFGDGDAPSVLYRVVCAPPALGAVPAGLHGLIAACLAKNPAERPTLSQLLQACQARAESPGDPGYGSASSFWPAPVAALIARYEGGLRDAAAALEPRGEPTHDVDGWRPERLGTSPQATSQAGRHRTGPTPSQALASGRGAAASGRPAVVSRRRALAGLAGAGVAVAGLASAGWALSGSGRARPRGAGRPRASGRPGTSDRVAWSHQTGGQVTSGAAAADGVVYIGSGDRNVYALEADTGRLVRTIPGGGPVSAAVTAAGPTLLAGSADGTVHALPIATGGASWSYRADGPVRCRPSLSGGVVYIGTDHGSVYALDTGQRKWRHQTGGAVRSSPQHGLAPFDSFVYVGSGDGYLYQLDADTGKPSWRFPAGGAVNSTPLQIAGGVYVGSDNGYLYEVLAGTGTGTGIAEWSYPVGGPVGGTPVPAGETLYVGSGGSGVYAVDQGDGKFIWRQRTAGAVRSGLALSEGVLYVGDDHGYLYAIDTATVTLRWKYRTGGPVRSQILVDNGLVYFGSLDGRVYALHA